MDQNDTPLEQGTEPEDNSIETTEPINNMEALLEAEGLGIDFPHQGEIREGVIASITPGQILVSVGTKSEGVISGREYESIPAEELAALTLGQTVPVYVINPEDSSGTLVLSLTRARDEVSWQDVEALLASRKTTETKIVGYNKGGLIALVNGIRGFIPASQIALGRRAGMTGDSPEQRYSSMVGDDISVTVIEVDRERRRLILSERAASTETRESVKDRLIDELNVGDIRTGRVTSLADFGAFVNINGADGLVHLSEISWDRIAQPSEVLKVGQEVKVKVIAVDREKRRIGLSIRQLLEDPWSDRVAQIKIGQLVEATITRLAKFGAFARLANMEDVEGLIHISEISEKRIDHPREALHEGDTITLRVIRIEPENHRIALSVRRVESMQYADQDWQTLLDQQEESENQAEDSVESSMIPEAEQSAGDSTAVEPAAEVAEAAVAEDIPASAPQPDSAPEEISAEAPADTAETGDLANQSAPEEPAA